MAQQNILNIDFNNKNNHNDVNNFDNSKYNQADLYAIGTNTSHNPEQFNSFATENTGKQDFSRELKYDINNKEKNLKQQNVKNFMRIEVEAEIGLSDKLAFLDYLLLYYWLALSILNFVVGVFLRTILEIEFNKKAYSLSFTFLVAGISGCGLSLLYLLLDLIKSPCYKKYFLNIVFEPFKWMGMNSILVYFGSMFYFVLLAYNIKFTLAEYGEEPVSLYKLFFDKVFLALIPQNPQLAEMLLCLFAALLFVIISYFFYCKKIFIKV